MTLPAKDTIATYGGTKSNYGIDPIDPTTDPDAADWNKMIATVADGSRMLPRCWARVACRLVSGSPVYLVEDFEAVWKGNTGTAPTIARTGAGVYTLTWPASVRDALGETHAVTLGHSTAWPVGAVVLRAQCQPATPNSVTLRTFDTSGALADIPTDGVVDVESSWAIA